MVLGLFSKANNCLVCRAKAKLTSEVMVYGYTRPIKRGFCSDACLHSYVVRSKKFFDNYAPGCRTCIGGPR